MLNGGEFSLIRRDRKNGGCGGGFFARFDFWPSAQVGLRSSESLPPDEISRLARLASSPRLRCFLAFPPAACCRDHRRRGVVEGACGPVAFARSRRSRLRRPRAAQ